MHWSIVYVIETHNRVTNVEQIFFLLKIRDVAYLRFAMGFIFRKVSYLDENNQRKQVGFCIDREICIFLTPSSLIMSVLTAIQL